ncbi:MAG: Asp-tRNA(Asn)/Glu-tRNA(Gln) amidotransferase subunit GatA [Calditrichaceae bacterium]
MTLKEKAEALKQNNFDLCYEVDKRLKMADDLSDLNAFVRLRTDQAKQKADDIQARIKAGEPVGPLAGTIIAIKDNINIENEFSTCGSKILENFKSPYSATVIEKLDAADAVIIGKTNQDEFAMGSSNENSYWGPVKNPHDKTKVSGGSSGGSAVSVSTGIADVALGSDTGGSIRQPASFCGVVGLKPSYGRVSRYGLIAYASSLDQIGPFSSKVEDTAYLLSQIAGHDAYDTTSVDLPVPDYTESLKDDVSNLSIGVPEEYFGDGLDPQIKDQIYSIIDQLRSAGARIKNIHFPMTDYGIATYYIIATAEASSNLARFDGVRYGLREGNDEDLITMYGLTRSSGFGKEVQRRIILGTYVLSSGYYDEYYNKAQKVRRLIKNEINEAFKTVDAIITPTTPTTAFKIGEKVDDPLTMYLSDVYTVTANLAGICGVNIPAGKDDKGLPFGMQLLGDAFQEAKILQLGNFIEKNCS